MVAKITVNELKAMSKENSGLKVVEALPAKYFNQGHLPNSVNIPLESSDEDIIKILPNKIETVVTYCSGPTCPNSGRLAQRLSELGYKRVFAFERGKEGWIQSGEELTK